jgi:branched-chain amino acid transport system permease protein
VTWTVTVREGLGAGLAVGALVGVLVLMGGGVVLERLLVRPFVARRGGDLLVMIVTLAGASWLQNAVQIVWGPRLKQLPTVSQATLSFGGTAVGFQQITAVILAPVLLIALTVFLKRSKLGFAIRAVEQNRDSALLAGVNVSAIYALTFALAAGLAAVAGILLGGIFFITPSMGDDPLLKAFIVVVFGGLGSLRGTIAGAYVIGLFEAASNFVVGLYWTPVVLFLVMIAVMVAKPTGLFAEEL